MGSVLDTEASGQQKVFCWDPEDPSGLGARRGQRLKAHPPPNPCSRPVAILLTSPLVHLLMSLQPHRIFQEAGSYLMSML